MIESKTTMLNVADISIGLRQRKEVPAEYIRELAQSISKMGLIHNIVVDKNLGLVAGECRLNAFKWLAETGTECTFPDYLNWTSIPARLAVNASEYELQCLELEENIKRRNLTWQEESEAVVRLHDLKSKIDLEWTAGDTAKLLSLDPTSIYRHLQAGRAIASGDEKIAKSSTLTSAVNTIRRRDDRKLEAEMAVLDDDAGEAAPPVKASIICEDFNRWASSYVGPKFNFIHCDFPYGIKHQNSDQGNRAGWDTYEDDPDVYWKLIHTLTANWKRIMLPSAHIMFWMSMNFYEQTKEKFLTNTCCFDPFPLIWHKSDGKGILPDPQRGPRRIYETALFGATGDRLIVSSVSNLYPAPVHKELHLSEKPESMLRHFFRMFVDENTVMLDPTCGSGTSVRAAEACGAKLCLGLEQDPAMAEAAEIKLIQARNLREQE